MEKPVFDPQMPPPSSGFTLVEVSIVMVLIATFIAAILATRLMIENARVKKDLSLIQDVTSATKAFELKYDFLPGDHPDPGAFFSAPRTNDLKGNGNNRIGITTGGTGNETAYCAYGCAGDNGHESTLFWLQLSEAGLIPLQTFRFANGATDMDMYAREGIGYPYIQGGTDLGLTITSSLTETANFFVYGAKQQWVGNQFVSFSYRSYSAYARMIDTKIDDARPRSGLVQNRIHMQDSPNPFAWVDCNDGIEYPATDRIGNCNLRIETKF
ncbi:MAG: prepilin-type N-terminal cleavage/methylation domain-containing protein [Rickettsiales bacterium]|nr:prepilin-type N-terminal cleavage/methylation domain-containing protein [Rickettsiales bacterium]